MPKAGEGEGEGDYTGTLAVEEVEAEIEFLVRAAAFWAVVIGKVVCIIVLFRDVLERVEGVGCGDCAL